MTQTSMASTLRLAGISVIGDVRWVTRVCYFYETRQDLPDTLVLYFKSGLENNEFRLWVGTIVTAGVPQNGTPGQMKEPV